LHMHGAGGIGKSALLERFSARAKQLGLPVVHASASDIGTRPDDIEAVFFRGAPSGLWIVDGLEHWRALDTWLRSRFLPQVPTGVRVITAGRRPLGVGWTSDPGWSHLCREIELAGL